MIAQLEHQAHNTDSFTLLKLVYYTSSSMETLDALNSLVEALIEYEHERKNEVASMRGGGVLTIISQRMVLNSGYAYLTYVQQQFNKKHVRVSIEGS